MDGIYTSQYRRIFLLTTNETHINENLLSRPSRLRYVKEFGNLEREVVEEYLKDNLKNSECIDCIVDFVDTLQISTIDILKTIVEDINIHGFDEFIANKDIFNVKTAKYYYYAYRVQFDDYEFNGKKYNIDEFLKDIKVFETVKVPQRYLFDTEEEFIEARKEYDKKRCKVCVCNSDIDTNKSWRSFKVRETFGQYDNERIIKIDIDKRVIITEDTEDRTIAFYYIKNPNTKPSLYSSSAVYVNPYYQFD